MSAEYFLDTNILLYAFDSRDLHKQTIARDLLRTALTTGNGIISWQVCQEFLHAALHKSALQISLGDLQDYLTQILIPLCRVHSSPDLWIHALSLQRQSGYRFYDSLIVASALHAGTGILLSEDLQHGRTFGALKIVNPFLKAGQPPK